MSVLDREVCVHANALSVVRGDETETCNLHFVYISVCVTVLTRNIRNICLCSVYSQCWNSEMCVLGLLTPVAGARCCALESDPFNDLSRFCRGLLLRHVPAHSHGSAPCVPDGLSSFCHPPRARAPAPSPGNATTTPTQNRCRPRGQTETPREHTHMPYPAALHAVHVRS